ncbi:MAG: HPr(Ser) kinase/phosphatase [Candidatus Krumholzibacteriota bacterium]|nr:HPr(Ser) kinase/phosphatase [Candidatus Krumholzibacteriota bacterium]
MEIVERNLPVARFVAETAELLGLRLVGVSPESGTDITVPEVSRPGFVLTGFTDKYQHERIQILGGAEFSFLETLPRDEVAGAIAHLFSRPVPCFIVTRGQEPFPELVQQAHEHGVPLLVTEQHTTRFIRALTGYLEDFFSPRGNVHGSLVDVYGVGLLVTGPSGIGKSEITLDLVERGHRLVADDVVQLIRRGGVLIGRGNEFLKHFMEIRGVGVIDVREMFGIRAIRVQKRVEVEVRLERWVQGKHYDRAGLEYQTSPILGVEIPNVVLPVTPGKNVTVIAETIAMNHMLKVYGLSPAERFNRQVMEGLARRNEARVYHYLQQDEE